MRLIVNLFNKGSLLVSQCLLLQWRSQWAF